MINGGLHCILEAPSAPTVVYVLCSNRQVSFLITFFVIEAASQTSTALGFAVLEIPDDVRLSGGGAELSADVTSSDGEPLEDVVCVVDLKVIQPLPPVARVSVHARMYNLNCTRAGSI